MTYLVVFIRWICSYRVEGISTVASGRRVELGRQIAARRWFPIQSFRRRDLYRRDFRSRELRLASLGSLLDWMNEVVARFFCGARPCAVTITTRRGDPRYGGDGRVDRVSGLVSTMRDSRCTTTPRSLARPVR